MKYTSAPPDDSFRIRCPRLGHQIYFAYCRQENMGLPCFKTLDCWYIHFDVAAHLREALSEAEWEKTFERPVTPKVLSLVDLIKKAQQGAKKTK